MIHSYCAASDRTRTHGHGHGNGHGKVARDRKVGFAHRVLSAGRIGGGTESCATGSMGPASASFPVSPRAPFGARARTSGAFTRWPEAALPRVPTRMSGTPRDA